MHRIVGAERHLIDAFRDAHTRQRAGKWLLVFMRMGEFAGTENAAVRGNHIPAVGIMLPALVTMAHGHIETVSAGALLDYFYADDTGLSVWVYSKYKHFDKMPDLELGDRVKMGQFLGPSGDSGTAGGHFPSGYPHLHMSIYTSRSPDYKTKKKAVIPADVQQLDPVAIYMTRNPPILDSHSARELADSEKGVPIPYKTTGGRALRAR